MKQFVDSKMVESDDPAREPCRLLTHDRATFAEDVLEAGGIERLVTASKTTSNVIEELQAEADMELHQASVEDEE